jgi:hypothetical protein
MTFTDIFFQLIGYGFGIGIIVFMITLFGSLGYFCASAIWRTF